LLDLVEFGRAYPCLFSDHLISEGACFEALLAVNIMGYAFSFHGAGGECHGSQDLSTSNGGSSLCGDEELAW
jgi:hypothetical protein